MKVSSRRFARLNPFIRLAFLGLFLSVAPVTQAADSATQVKVDPEIARISYMQGDVRFSRGDSKGPDLSTPWEAAVANLPILQNYSVATGNGRAEIEFEYGSTLYLAENSVLIFDTLTVRNGIPSTVMELATGTATVSVHPISIELFEITTPTDRLRFPSASFVRVDSYLDAMALTAQDDSGTNIRQIALSKSIPMAKGQTIVYRDGVPVQLGSADQSGTPADWDSWVATRVAQRKIDTAAAMNASGLTSFIPGLLDMYNGGTFFPCAPFGTCWEPNELSETTQSSAQAGNENAATGLFQLAAMHMSRHQAGAAVSQSQHQGTPPAKKQKPKFADYYYPLGGCPPSELHVVTRIDPVTGKEIVVEESEYTATPPWEWGLCHSGAWIHLGGRGTRYTFVVGKKRHHPPVHWMRTSKGNVYVPRHPSDVKGQAPLNLKYGVFQARNGLAGPVELMNFKANEKYTVLKEAPKEFRDARYPQLASAQRPEIQGRLVTGAKPAPGKDGKTVASAITYDYKTRTFVRAGEPVGGRTGKPVVVGGYSARGGYSSGATGRTGGGSSAGRTSSGGSGASSHGGSSGGSSGGGGGGGSHGGGGSAGSGGGGGGGHTGRGL